MEYQRLELWINILMEIGMGLKNQKLDLLEHEMEHQHDDPALMRALISDVIATDTRWKKSYRSPYEASKPDSK